MQKNPSEADAITQLVQAYTLQQQQIQESKRESDEKFKVLTETLNSLSSAVLQRNHGSSVVARPTTLQQGQEPVDGDTDSLRERFVPMQAKWSVLKAPQLEETLKKCHREAIVAEDEEAEEYLYNTIKVFTQKPLDWLRNRLALFKDGQQMTAEERRQCLQVDARPQSMRGGSLRRPRGRNTSYRKPRSSVENPPKRDF